MRRTAAAIVREYGPFPGVDRVNGVTYDGERVWFADGARLNALDPDSGGGSTHALHPSHPGAAPGVTTAS